MTARDLEHKIIHLQDERRDYERRRCSAQGNYAQYISDRIAAIDSELFDLEPRLMEALNRNDR